MAKKGKKQSVIKENKKDVDYLPVAGEERGMMYEMYTAGWEIDEIADHFKVPSDEIQHQINKVSSRSVRLSDEQVQDIKAVSINRLNRLFNVAYEQAIKFKKSTDLIACVKIIETQCKVAGVDSVKENVGNNQYIITFGSTEGGDGAKDVTAEENNTITDNSKTRSIEADKPRKKKRSVAKAQA